jgi:hypothetical protein
MAIIQEIFRMHSWEMISKKEYFLNLGERTVKYRITLALGLLTSAITLQASNPYSFVESKGAIQKLASIGKNMASYTKEKDWAKFGPAIEKGLQSGNLNNALYLRMLLSEFYCARCAIGASAFNTSALAPETTWPSKSNNQYTNHSGNMQPGGFVQSTVNSFVTKAQKSASNLMKGREAFEAASNYYYKGTKIVAPDILDNFAGIILIPETSFIKTFGTRSPNGEQAIELTNNYWFGKAQLFRPTKTSETSLSIAQKTASGNSVLDIVLTSKSSTYYEGGERNTPFRLGSITGSVMGGTIAPIEPSQEMISFFKNAPNNPWALVVSISMQPKFNPKSTSNKKQYTTHHTVLAMVQLNPLSVTLRTVPAIKTLSDLPSNLYNTTSNPDSYAGTPTARLLRGIANGYLTSSKYNSLKNPAPVMNPEGTFGQATGSYRAEARPQHMYPTPSPQSFESQNDNEMFYALYATKIALNSLYIHQVGHTFPDIETIIASPTQTIPGIYFGASGSYQPVLKLSTTQKTASLSLEKTKHAIGNFLSKSFNKLKNVFQPNTHV